jgi:hypothetical protein
MLSCPSPFRTPHCSKHKDVRAHTHIIAFPTRSGDMHDVPTMEPCAVSTSFAGEDPKGTRWPEQILALASPKPKSSGFVAVLVSVILPGFRSRCVPPFGCALSGTSAISMMFCSATLVPAAVVPPGVAVPSTRLRDTPRLAAPPRQQPRSRNRFMFRLCYTVDSPVSVKSILPRLSMSLVGTIGAADSIVVW